MSDSKKETSSPIFILLPGIPRTKKNSQRFIRPGVLLQNKRYVDYEQECMWELSRYPRLRNLMLDTPVNVRVHVYKKDKIRSDLIGYLQSLSDILVKARVLADDNFNIIKGYDGSRIFIDAKNPRVEIIITPFNETLNEETKS